MSALKKEFKVLNRPGWSAGSSSSSQPMSNEFTAIQVAMNNIFCKGSVDTTILGVDTMVQNKGRNVKKSPSQVDTSPEQVDTTSSQVDTRDLFQGTIFQVWDSVSTHLLGRSTHSVIFVTQDSSWTRGTLGRWWINLGSCAHVPQGYLSDI
ncbi:hypothetical protein Taro_033939 [Colocasia esculenta]|uniref:Uncharacterized protein n=1 Tax=Colocasia esculenta TaxID=4460 RepID=A0A843VZC5_COLES|nr:hypothetical protein [Colocasia esculenta]